MIAEPHRIDLVIVGAGAPGLTFAYSLRALGLVPLRDFVVVDDHPHPGARWQDGWDFMTIERGLRSGELVDLPGQAELGMGFGRFAPDALVRDVVPQVWAGYQDAYELFVAHGVRATRAATSRRSDRIHLAFRRPDGGEGFADARMLVNATGRWSNPFVPWYPGADRFAGSVDHVYRVESFGDYAGKRVLVVGGGHSAVAVLLELERRGAATLWSTLGEPDFHEVPRLGLASRPSVRVGELSLTRRGRIKRMAARGKVLPSDVEVRGIPMTREIFDGIRRGTLASRGPLARLEPDAARFEDGTLEPIDAVLWATGGREATRYLAPLGLRDAGGTPKVASGWSRRDERVAFLDYGPGVDPATALDDAVNLAEDVIDRLAT